MRNLTILLSFITISLASCTKDQCKDVVCVNGGECIDGSCLCPAGFTGVHCETVVQNDPCQNITCLNGGTCVNGQCNCTPGYTGANCSQQITPDKIRISRVLVTRHPATDGGGAGWDLTSGGDIYVELLKNGTSLYTSGYVENANSSSDYQFQPSPYLDLNDPSDQYTIRLYDYDPASADDYMGGILFYPYGTNNGFPSTINIDASGDVAFELDVTYIW